MSERRERTDAEREAARLERERRRAGRKAPRQAIAPPRKAKEPAREAKRPARELIEPPMEVQEPAREPIEPPMEAKQPARELIEPPMEAQEPAREGARPDRAAARPARGLTWLSRGGTESSGGAATEPSRGATPRPEPADPPMPIESHPPIEPSGSSGTLRFEGGPSVGALGAEDELPVGTRRVSRIERVRSARRRPRKRGAITRRSRMRGRGLTGRYRAGRALALISLLLAAAVIWFLVELYQPSHGSGHGALTVTIPAHTSSSQVGDLLSREGVIASSFFFELRATLAGDRSDLHPGTYRLKLDMSYGAVLSILRTSPPAAKVTDLTITEGRTRRQVSNLLHAQGVRGRYFTATKSSPLLDPRSYGAPRGTPSLEGFLFPSTYQLREPTSVTALIADQLRTFKQRFATVDLTDARRHHLSAYDVLIVASMVEAESPSAHDRPLIASVIYNRLRDGKPLQIDATSRYETGNYTRPLTVSELHSPSAYNTRIHKGLPPTPIDNPGLAAIGAAAHPASTNYLYFVVKPCGNGAQAFTSSYAQFLADAQRYQAARTRRGGRSPVRC